jgi:hypothetical protein
VTPASTAQPAATTSTPWRWHPVGLLLAAAAFAHNAMLLSGATNDNFMHLALARQLLKGDLPVRDFYDSGLGLTYALSALGELAIGYRLLSEAVIVGLAWAVSTYLVFALVRRLSASTIAASLSALLLIVAGPRGYSYPKGIIYAVAAALWWSYARTPTKRWAAAWGVWVAVSFYWRPDHGVYVAIGALLAVSFTHGLRRVTLARCAVAGAVTLALTLPFAAYVEVVDGLWNYIGAEVAQSVYEHGRTGGHRWPLIQLPQGFWTLDAHARASETTVALFEALPILAIVVAATPLRRHVPGVVSRASLAGFALFTLVVDAGLLRTPYDVRAVDGVVLPAILFGCCATALARGGAGETGILRWSARVGATALVVATVTSVAGAGAFTHQAAWILQLRSADGWRRPFAEFVTSPPVEYFRSYARRADVSVAFAEYARACVPSSDRILVLWFAPEIYYYADRLMAARHAVFVTNWSALPHEQDATIAKIARYKPPVAFARRAALDAYTRETFPGLIDYVNEHYRVAATVDKYEGEQYLVLARTDRTPTGRYGAESWPCYTAP